MNNNLRLVVNNVNDKKLEEKHFFEKDELKIILDLYAKMVSEGSWKDYGLSISSKQVGFSVFKRLGSDFIDTGSKVISVEKTTTPAPDNVPVLQVEVDQAPSPALALDDEVLLAIPNPYYDINFAHRVIVCIVFLPTQY